MNKKIIILIVIVIVLIVGLLYFFNSSEPASNNLKQGTVSGFQFVQPTTTPSIMNPPQSPPPGAKMNTTHNIVMKNFSFNPNILNINKGDSVIWTNQDSAPHNVAVDDSESPILTKGQTFVYIFNNIGVFDYHCPLHPSMRGTITVK